MTEAEAHRLRALIERNRARYREQLRGRGAWDYCVLTASSGRQAHGYELEIARRRRAGWLPPGTVYLVVPDLQGRRIGSAGAAAYALREVLRHRATDNPAATGFPRVLILNSGGDSKRVPHCSLLGKAFAGLPLEVFPGGPPAAVFDELLISLACLSDRLEGGTVILSGDVLLAFGADGFRPGEGVTGLAYPGPWPLATRHGVYICAPTGGAVEGFLQKPTREQMAAAGALHGEEAFVDTGLLYFDAEASRRLAGLAGVRWEDGSVSTPGPRFEPGLLEEPGLEAAGIDLYHELCLLLAGETVGLPDDAPEWRRRVVAAVGRAFTGIGFSVTVSPPTSFIHLGSTAEWRDFCTGAAPSAWLYPRPGPEREAALSLRGNVIGEVRTAGPAVIEHCELPWCEVGEGAVVVGAVLDEGLVVPPGIVWHQAPLLGEAGERWVVHVYGAADNPKLDFTQAEATCCGEPFAGWLARRGLSPEVIWPHVSDEARCLWNARLFVVGDRAATRRGADWLLHGGNVAEPAGREWQGAARVSLEESAQQADVVAVHEQRLRLGGAALAREVAEGVAGEGWVAGRFAALGGAVEVTAVAEALMASLETEENVLVRARAYQALSDLFGDGRLQRMLTAESGQCAGQMPPDLAELSRRFARRKLHTPFETSNWLEGLAFDEVRAAVGLGLEALPLGRHGALVPGQRAVVQAPARIDFAGGWSDTPPFSLERGGAVLNAALLLDGARPIVARGEVLAEPVIELVSVDGHASETVRDAMSFTQYAQPGDPLALHKAAIVLSGLAGPGPSADFPDFLRAVGGGLRLETEIQLPQGSGLGTSSIAAMVLLKCLDLLQDRDATAEDLSSRVLYLEQMLTTGGGWQDQLGALFPGLKLLETDPGLAQRPRSVAVALAPETEVELHRRLLVCFVGEKRMAKHILREVVRRYLARDPEAMAVLNAIRDTAREMKTALEAGSVDGFGTLVARSWELNKRLDAQATTEHVEGLMAAMVDLVSGAKLSGAGGGGFMAIVAKDEEAARRLVERLTPLLHARGGRFYGAELDPSGMTWDA